MQVRQQEIEVRTISKIFKRKKEVIECSVANNIFKIGHSNIHSETFLPFFHLDQDTGITFTDVAGFNDTNGVFIEAINNLLIKHILKKARNVRFLLPIRYEQITESRGQSVKEQLNIILRMSNTSLATMEKSLLPLLTCVKPNPKKDTYANSAEGSDIDEVRSILDTQLAS